MMKFASVKFVLILFFLIALVGLAGCTAGTEAEPAAGPTQTEAPTPTPDPQVEFARAAFERSPHAAVYALEKGPNTYCARCHSPANWDPAAAIDPPPNCVSCKFPNEPEPRIATGNPLLTEEEWQGITCATCHPVADGQVDPALAWHDTRTGYDETVKDSSELCTHCHQDTETLRHARTVEGEAHAGFTCTDCHDPHETTASCAESGCHATIVPPLPPPLPEHQDQTDTSECTSCHHSVADIHMNFLDETPVACMDCHRRLFAANDNEQFQVGHGEAHVNVACVTCHDASGLEVGLLEEENVWRTFRTTELLGRTQKEPYTSHQLTGSVDCTRCHAAGNPWDLPPVQATAAGGENE